MRNCIGCESSEVKEESVETTDGFFNEVHIFACQLCGLKFKVLVNSNAVEVSKKYAELRNKRCLI